MAGRCAVITAESETCWVVRYPDGSYDEEWEDPHYKTRGDAQEDVDNTIREMQPEDAEQRHNAVMTVGEATRGRHPVRLDRPCWQLQCDACEYVADEGVDGGIHFESEKDAIDWMKGNDWTTDGTRHYCNGDDCYRLVSRSDPRWSVLAEIARERARQDEKWGQQNHASGTGPSVQWLRTVPSDAPARLLAEWFTSRCQANTPDCDNWRDILMEEVAEAFAEGDPLTLRYELIQVAAVAALWVECLDRRSPWPTFGVTKEVTP